MHSRDLVNWKTIGHVLSTPQQLNLDGIGVSRGIFAPTIRFHEGVFYVTCTLMDGGGNFVSTTKDPGGWWTDPVWIPELDNGIDPSLFFDEENAYIVYNGDAPHKTPLYSGHRSIRMYAFDVANLKVKGEEKLLISGGVDISKNPIWIEAPHIFKVNDFYYLICAEGGTGYDHSEVVFRSKNVDGPYEPYEGNPILTQRHLDRTRKNPVTTAGHGDFVQTESGDWWAVFLACRPYEDDFYNTGRETFLAPVQWKNGWPIINPEHAEVQTTYDLPVKQRMLTDFTYGYFNHRYDFNADNLDLNFMFLRTPKGKWFSFEKNKGYLSLLLRPETCSENVNPSFIGHRQTHLEGHAITSVAFSPVAENEKAGLLVFQDENHFYFLCQAVSNGNSVVQVFRSLHGKTAMEKLAEKVLTQNSAEVELKIEASRDHYNFFFRSADGNWISVIQNVDARYLSTKEAGGFVGCVYAMYATSLGQPSDTLAHFHWFETRTNDPANQ
jgi:xylan 1,4-beta-xylosidase